MPDILCLSLDFGGFSQLQVPTNDNANFKKSILPSADNVLVDKCDRLHPSDPIKNKQTNVLTRYTSHFLIKKQIHFSIVSSNSFPKNQHINKMMGYLTHKVILNRMRHPVLCFVHHEKILRLVAEKKI